MQSSLIFIGRINFGNLIQKTKRVNKKQQMILTTDVTINFSNDPPVPVAVDVKFIEKWKVWF